VVLAAQAGLAAPSPRGLAALGLTTRRIEAVPPTPTSEPPTSSVATAGKDSAARVWPTAAPGRARGSAALVPESATVPRVPDRDHALGVRW
jgi:hypothetical protein